MLLVEHNLPVVFGLADEVTVLHQGQVIGGRDARRGQRRS